MPSPYKQPKELKVIKGTLKKSRELKNPMELDLLVSIPMPPSDLPETAKATWYNVGSELHKLGILSTLDLGLLKAYCYQTYVLDSAMSHLQTEGFTQIMQNKAGGMYPVKSPWVSIYNEALTHVSRIGQMFGFSPSSRQKISANTKQEEKDPLADYMNA
jgi:P27 family predicted phage terminase small subunit